MYTQYQQLPSVEEIKFELVKVEEGISNQEDDEEDEDDEVPLTFLISK